MSMALYGFKDGLTNFNQAQMNALLSAQPSSLIFDGSLINKEMRSGTTEFNLSTNSYGVTLRDMYGKSSLGRVEFEVVKYG
ncbi:hypothetical protein [Ammoniphilus sp. 3BR4]|uniref:hypothetical protein n=1 Tax=Ammoniphilus sp. 3BR4 TaxID=3158265 RepID=UPI0034664E5D